MSKSTSPAALVPVVPVFTNTECLALAGFLAGCRAAVSKHLGLLREARLVRVREEGREWHYTLDPGPLAEVYEHWLGSFAPLWDETLSRLKVAAERPPPKAAQGTRPDKR